MKIVHRERVDDSCLAGVIKDPLLRQLLVSRGMTSAQDLQLELKDLYHYHTLKDIDKAADLLCEALQAKDHIRVLGDYDVDGMTGTALGVRCLRAFYAEPDKVSFQVPSRYDDGYGLNAQMVKKAAEDGVKLILTVDNGISCHEAVDEAKKLGLKVVITDHHEPGASLPQADAVVNPKRRDDNFPSKNLCGVGVLFYVMIALRAKLKEAGYFDAAHEPPVLAQFLDLVTIGTIGDVVPLDANNRRLVRAGLQRMQHLRAQPGIIALAQHVKINMATVNSYNVAFDICPRLNAAGRLKLADNPAVDCLLTDDYQAACEYADRLNNCNLRRGDYEKQFLAEAREDAAMCSLEHSIIVFRPHWLTGIAGLLASRLKDQFARPCFVFAGDGDEVTGSARSVPGFPLAQALSEINEEHPGLLMRCGGHSMAAGATIQVSRLEEFRKIFEECAARYLTCCPEPEIVSDGVLPSGYFNLSFAKALEHFGPWGQGCPEPQFDGEFLIQNIRLLGSRNLRMRLTGQYEHFDAIKFRATAQEKMLQQGMKVRTVFSLVVNRYNGMERLEAKIHAIEPV